MRRQGRSPNNQLKENIMEENEFWIAIWRVVGGCICAIALTVAGCSSYRTSKVAEAIASGADPIRARCGLINDGGAAEAAICGAVAAK